MMNNAENLDEIIEDNPEIVEPKEAVDEDLRGFISKEDWVASGKDAKDWRDPVEFRHKGEIIRLKQEMQRETDNQFKNLNLLHELQLKNQRDELLRLRDDAIDVADKAEVKRLDAQIAANDKAATLIQPQQAQQNTNKLTPEQSLAVAEWEEENPWIYDKSDPRSVMANNILSNALAQGKTITTGLRRVDEELKKKFGAERHGSPSVESSRTAGGKREVSNTVDWSDLKADELDAWKTGMFNNPKEKDGGKAAFLKTVYNARKGIK